MTEYMCYRVKLVNPNIMLQAMLTEGAIIGVVKEALEKYNMTCGDVLVERYECDGDKMMGEEMTPDEYRRARIRSIPGKRQIPRK